MNRTYFGGSAVPLEYVHNFYYILRRQRFHVFAEVDRQIKLAILLIGSDCTSRYFGEDIMENGVQPFAVGCTCEGVLGINALHPVGTHTEVQATVLADHAIYGPHPR